MLGNIVDRRTNRFCPEVDVVFEPSAHDNAVRPDGSAYFPWAEVDADPAAFHVYGVNDTTVRAAVLRADTEWPFPVTAYLYDKGSRPMG